MNENDIYCIDTSSIVSAWNIYYPHNNFTSLWNNISHLISVGRLISPQEVYIELTRKNDDVLNWVKSRKKIFRLLTEDEQLFVTEILQKFPQLINPNRADTQADPQIIALAHNKNYIVVTEERPDNAKKKKTKIPTVCGYYGIKWIHFIDIIRREGWNF